MSDLLAETRRCLKKLHVAPSKKMGQNFMIAESVLDTLAEAVTSGKGECVLEIGPGLGFLTRRLLKKGVSVVAVEKDGRLAGYLRRQFCDDPVRILEQDVLRLDLSRETEVKKPVRVIGNIPYSITSPILDWLISQKDSVPEAILTVQKEVAERLTASPGTKAWGVLSIFIQVFARVKLIQRVGRTSFWPVPKVDSAVIRLGFAGIPLYEIADIDTFSFLVRRSFQKRRKTLLNSLEDRTVPSLEKRTLEKTLVQAGIDSRRRPETLSIPEWARLAAALPFSKTSVQ